MNESESTRKHKASTPSQLGFGVFVVSSSRFQNLELEKPIKDPSGDLIVELLEKAGHQIAFRKILPDDQQMIEAGLKRSLESEKVDAVVFVGGTGISSEDVTVEAISPFLKKKLPGFGEVFRRLSFDKAGSAAFLSRALAGVVKGKVVFCVPGSPDAVKLCAEELILPEAGHIVKHIRE